MVKIEVSARGILLIGLALLGIWALIELWPVIVLLMVSFVLMLGFLPFVEEMVRRGIPRTGAVLILVFGFLRVLIALFSIMIPAIVEEVDAVQENLPESAREIEELLANFGIDVAFPEYRHQGGTMIIGGHGRLGDTADVAIFRNMIVVVRDRIRDLIAQGMTLPQIKAAKPTLDYDGIYGQPDRFVDAVYQSLTAKR